MDVQLPPKANAELSKASKPGMGSLHYPAVLARALAAFYALSGNPARYVVAAQVYGAFSHSLGR